MGDLRNKYYKDKRDAEHAELMGRLRPKKADPPPLRCQCGRTTQETTIWAIDQGWRRRPKFYCLKCLPCPDPRFACGCGAHPTWVERHNDGRIPTLYCEACRVKAGLKL